MLSIDFANSRFWVLDKRPLLTRAHSDSNLHVAIISVGQIADISSPTAGSTSWPIQGWLWVTFKTSRKLGAWPVHMSALDWIPVDTLMEGIANLTGEQTRNDTVQVYNMTHPNPAPWDLLYKTMQTRFGLEAEPVTLPRWLDRLDPKTFRLHAFLKERARRGRRSCGRPRQIEELQVPKLEQLRMIQYY
ncbi:hypothetical protein KJE20_08815 [Pyrenophora tritici-repentis]|nr:hypothetical protein KJE20_08815 [Pyrenophora tritici-repentis]